jgi:tetratricopeptide (TPR) repeat protein
VLLGDAREYDLWAQRIAAGDGWGSQPFYQAPLYPYFLALLRRLFDAGPEGVRAVQALIGATSCVLIARAGRSWFDVRTGRVAGLLFALYAPAIYFDGLLQKAALAGGLAALLLFCLGELRRETTPARALATGATLGAFALTRENALVLLPVVGLWLVVGGGSQRAPRPLAALAAMLVGAALLLVPVGLRNLSLGGGFQPTTTQLGTNFYIGNGAAANGTYVPLRPHRGGVRYERTDATDIAEAQLGRRLDPSQVSSYWLERAAVDIRADPGGWLALLARKALMVWHAREWQDTESIEVYREHSPLLDALAWLMHFGVLAPLAVLGLWASRRDARRLWILYAAIGSVAASVALFYVVARYRHPLAPLLVLFSSVGLLHLWDTARARAWPRLLGALAITAAAAVICNWPLPQGRDPRIVNYHNLGRELSELARFEEARSAYRRALALEPDFGLAHYGVGESFLLEGESAQALPHLREALRLQPRDARATTSLGIARLSLGEREGAERLFTLALRLDPGLAAAHNGLAAVRAEQGRFAEAAGHVERAITLSPEDADLHLNLAQLRWDLGDPTAALLAVTRALVLEPSHPGAQRLHAKLQRERPARR